MQLLNQKFWLASWWTSGKFKKLHPIFKSNFLTCKMDWLDLLELALILNYLPVRDQLNARLVCWHWRLITDSSKGWVGTLFREQPESCLLVSVFQSTWAKPCWMGCPMHFPIWCTSLIVQNYSAITFWTLSSSVDLNNFYNFSFLTNFVIQRSFNRRTEVDHEQLQTTRFFLVLNDRTEHKSE